MIGPVRFPIRPSLVLCLAFKRSGYRSTFSFRIRFLGLGVNGHLGRRD